MAGIESAVRDVRAINDFAVLNLSRPLSVDWPDERSGIVIAHGNPDDGVNGRWLDETSCTLTEAELSDRRWIRVASVAHALFAKIETRVSR